MAEGSKNVNVLAIVLGAIAGVSTGFAIYFGIKNNQYLTDWKTVLTNNPKIVLTDVKNLPKP